MATLYVENVPDDLYQALRKQAKQSRRSVAAEVISLLEAGVPTERALNNRMRFLTWVKRRHASERTRRRFPTTEEMIREDRDR